MDQRAGTLRNFYENSTILVTGATGFLGKLLICKLLGTFSGISKIYIIVRPKKMSTAQNRIDEYFNDSVFSNLLAKFPEAKEKVRGITGDCMLPGLGLTLEDTNVLTTEVQIVFHAAATVRMKEDLSSAVSVNLRGTQTMLELCEGMKQLKALVYISTAYSHCVFKRIEEKIIDDSVKYRSILKLVELLDPTTLSRITPSLIGKWPNTYTFTKYLAEQTISESKLPVGILRPGIGKPLHSRGITQSFIVISTYMDPVPGWIDNFNGPSGITARGLSGFIRCASVDGTKQSNVVPADWCVNAIIAAGKDIHKRKQIAGEQCVPVYNYCSSDNSITWGEFNSLQKLGLHTPLATAAWYFSLNMFPNPFSFKLASFFLHYLPAYILDFIFMTIGRKRRFVAMYNKIDSFMEAVLFASKNEWHFENNNVHTLWNNLDSHEQEQLPFHMPNLSWEKYFDGYIPGMVKTLLGQKEEALPAARRRYMWLYILHQTSKICLMGLAAYSSWCLIYFVYIFVA